MRLHAWWSDTGQHAATRFLDVSVSATALLLVSPLLAAIAIGVKLSSPGPVLYRARRVGRAGTVFTLYKFRTMTVEAAPAGPAITRHGDPRITTFGRLLRRTKLDELPQFFNTLMGEMSLVGPRPEDPGYVELYTREERRVLDVKPGITSPATILHRHEEELLVGPEWEHMYRTKVLPEKLRIELDYLSRRTFGRDLMILAQTAAALLRRSARASRREA
jgi:lipopolysaccharide/colanic/teichoic acid biosynthesis glycosyltransferase